MGCVFWVCYRKNTARYWECTVRITNENVICSGDFIIWKTLEEGHENDNVTLNHSVSVYSLGLVICICYASAIWSLTSVAKNPESCLIYFRTRENFNFFCLFVIFQHWNDSYFQNHSSWICSYSLRTWMLRHLLLVIWRRKVFQHQNGQLVVAQWRIGELGHHWFVQLVGRWHQTIA